VYMCMLLITTSFLHEFFKHTNIEESFYVCGSDCKLHIEIEKSSRIRQDIVDYCDKLILQLNSMFVVEFTNPEQFVDGSGDEKPQSDEDDVIVVSNIKENYVIDEQPNTSRSSVIDKLYKLNNDYSIYINKITNLRRIVISDINRIKDDIQTKLTPDYRGNCSSIYGVEEEEYCKTITNGVEPITENTHIFNQKIKNMSNNVKLILSYYKDFVVISKEIQKQSYILTNLWNVNTTTDISTIRFYKEEVSST
jgi:hypothetical protein